MGNSMRLTVSRKIIISLVTLVCIGALSMPLIYQGLRTLKHAMQELVDMKEPSSAAAYEMEININGMGLAVLQYLGGCDPLYRQWVDGGEADFEHFHAMYLRLTESPQGKELGHRIGELYREFKTLGRTLIQKRNEQAAAFIPIAQNFEKIDTIIDAELQPKEGRHSREEFQKIEALLDLEADVAEEGIWLSNYQRVPKEEYERLIFEHNKEIRDTLQRFKNANLTSEERRWGMEIEHLVNQTTSLLGQVVALEDFLRDHVRRFVEIRLQMDQLLDNEIQVLALHELATPRSDALPEN